MSDIHCAICNEPWDSHGLNNGDVKAWEADLIRKGIGCPCCNANGFIPLISYYKPSPLLMGNCYYCSKDIMIDQNEFIYNSNKRELINDDILEYLRYIDDNLYCLECAKEIIQCYECNKWIHNDNSYYIQGMNEVRCEDCMDDITTCNSCQEADRSSNMRFVDSKPYCSSCYAPDMEIQNESD